MNGDPLPVVLLITLAIAGVVGGVVVDTATSPETKAYAEASEQWCDDHDGALINVQAVYKGGLHCQFDNGSMVSMADIDLDVSGGESA